MAEFEGEEEEYGLERNTVWKRSFKGRKRSTEMGWPGEGLEEEFNGEEEKYRDGVGRV